MMHELGTTAVLHGHTHHPHQGHLSAKATHGQTGVVHIPVLGCGSSTWSKRGRNLARFNVLNVGAAGIESVESLLWNGEADAFQPEHTDLLTKAMHGKNAIVL